MRQVTLVVALAAVAAVGCTAHTMTLPANFVPFDKPGGGMYFARGVSADGVVVGLRSEQNRKEGTIDFWAEAVRNQLTEGKGYRFQGGEDVACASGQRGRLLTFTADESGVNFTYLIALFVQPQAVLIAEAGGKTEALKAKTDEIKKAFASIK